jgi:hypothetical protein
MQVRVLLTGALVAILAAGCAGRSGTVPASRPASPQSVSATFRIAIPRATAAQKRKPAYVSASTQSAAVTVTPGNSTTIINCSAGACSGSVLAPVGSDTFAVNLYDGTNASGNLLSTGTLTQTIGYQNNTVSVTFNGVVNSLALAVSPNLINQGSPATIAVTVNALDPDGNVIVGPGGYVDANGDPVTITLTDSDTSGATQLSASSLAQPASTVTLSYDGSTGGQPARYELPFPVIGAQAVTGSGSIVASAASATLYALGPAPGEPMSRCAVLSLTPAPAQNVFYVGQTITVSFPPAPGSCGEFGNSGPGLTWYWEGTEQSRTSGCQNWTDSSSDLYTAAFDTCVVTASFVTAGVNTYSGGYDQLCLGGDSIQGGWGSCIAFAVLPRSAQP